ncbi:DUF456 domain-containing protein [Microbacteriaceae bacterium 4G12]
MDLIYWLLIIICFLLAFVSFIYPMIPGVLALWAGFWIYHFGIRSSELTTTFWVIQVLFTVFLFVIDFVANRYFLQKSGSTKWSERVGMVSIIIGSFFFPPLGLLIVPFVFVFATEILHKKTVKAALIVAFATVLSFLSSSIAKAILQLIMIIIFLLYIL